ncbi:MAG: ABC transporter ATP-binding protein/permease [Candidatus Uhrbacteria bacterium]|nr:ABC transporter ATP-binding protein/permease [Candidatus Uhrbacteria bacterium]
MPSAKEYVIPTLNEKPTSKEILGTVPFIAKFIFRSAPKSFAVWTTCGILQIPLASGSVFALKGLVDGLSVQDFSRALFWIWILLGVYAAMGVNQYLMDYQTDVIRNELEYASNEQVIVLMSSLPFSILEQTEFRILSDAFQRKAYVFLNIAQWAFWGLYYLANALGLLAILAIVPWQATFVLGCTIICRIFISKRESKWHWSLFDREKREGRRASYIRMILSSSFSLLSIKSWGLHQPFIKTWKKLMGGLLEASLKNIRDISKAYAVTEFMYVLSVGLALLFLFQGAKNGSIAIGSISAFLIAFPSFWGKIGNVLSNYRMIQRDAAFLVVARDFLSLQPERDIGRQLGKERLIVEFQDVHFSYPGSSEEVLRGIHCSFREGDRLALVGLNGAGKSTMLKLLMGIFQPTKGRILVNGIDLADIKPSAWRRALSVMGQDVPRFDDTLREQILYGDYSKMVDEKRLNLAIESSGLRSVLPDFKRGLETHAGKQYAMTEDEAIELSGGQNQIVGIARALYRDARMYIFDEPTSAVDPEKEENFFRSLPDVLAGKGIIFVSHRFSTLRQAEHIIVIDAGRVIEEGSHEELMFKKGRYAELFTLQAKAYQ